MSEVSCNLDCEEGMSRVGFMDAVMGHVMVEWLALVFAQEVPPNGRLSAWPSILPLLVSSSSEPLLHYM